MFNVGDLVIHGVEGICQIVEIRAERLTDETESLYYILKPMLAKEITIHAPVDKQLIPVFAVPSKQELETCLDEARNAETPVWLRDKNVRTANSKVTLRSGDPKQLIGLIRMYGTEGHTRADLTGPEHDMDKRAALLVAREIAVVFDIELEAAQEMLREITGHEVQGVR